MTGVTKSSHLTLNPKLSLESKNREALGESLQRCNFNLVSGGTDTWGRLWGPLTVKGWLGV